MRGHDERISDEKNYWGWGEYRICGTAGERKKRGCEGSKDYQKGMVLLKGESGSPLGERPERKRFRRNVDKSGKDKRKKSQKKLEF